MHPLVAGQRWSRLTPAECERIDAAALAILERTGIRLLDEEAVGMLRRAGASVADDGTTVRIPARLVEWARSVTPSSFGMYDRLGRPAWTWGGDEVVFGPGSDCLNVIDHRTGERRRPVLADVEAGITLVDALDGMGFAMSMFLPSDVDQRIADRYQLAVMLERTTKPIVLVTYELDGLVDALDMAEAVAGGPEALRERPFLACYINVTRGLLAGADAIRKLFLLVDRGVPALWIPVTSGGTTGPVTSAGNVAVNTAGVLAGLVLAQLRREGAPVVIPGFGGDALDLRTMVDPYAEPDHRGMAEAMAHHYGLPMFSLAAGGEAKVVDQQAAMEASLTLLVDALARGNVIHDCGYLESGLTGSLAQLVICDEIVTWIRRLLAPVRMDDEALALDLVDERGIDGSFLEADHTLAHYRERWYPDLVERFNFDAWQARGSQTMAERASARAETLIAAQRPVPLEPGARATIDAVIERAAARFPA